MGLWGSLAPVGLPGTPAEDAKPWLLPAAPVAGDLGRKTRLRTLATSQGAPGSGFCTVTQILHVAAICAGIGHPGTSRAGF